MYIFNKKYYAIEERSLEYLSQKSWNIPKGSKVMGAFGSGTLACFAQDMNGESCYAVTAQHVVKEKDDSMVIYTKASEHESGESKKEIELSTSCFGILKVIDENIIDIAMLKISDSLGLKDQFTSQDELIIGDLNRGGEGKLVYMIGAESSKIRCKICDPDVWFRKDELDGRGFFLKPINRKNTAVCGDSGALVCSRDENNVVFGLLMVAIPCHNKKTIFGCVKIKDCLKALKDEHSATVKLYESKNATWISQ